MSIRAITTGPVSVEEAKLLQKQYQQALKEIAEAEKKAEYYKDGFEIQDQADIAFFKAKITSLLASVNTFLRTGRWEAPAASGSGNTEGDAFVQLVGDMRPGWNGDFLLDTTRAPRPDWLDEETEYAGTIYLKEEGSMAALQLSSTATELVAYNRGKDVIYVETYKDAEGNLKKRAWIGKDHVTKVDIHIAIDAHKVQNGVKIDMSRVYRVSDGSNGSQYGTKAGVTIVGSDFNDRIIGSQGDDRILGLKGDDTISGMAGDDIIYGDDDEDWARARGATSLADGDDTIDGSLGKDVIDGGGGFNTGFKGDATDGEKLINMQDRIETRNTTPATSSWRGNDTHGWTTRESSPGVVELTENYDPGSEQDNILDIKMPDGYHMAFAEEMGNDLKITFVGENADGSPKTFVVIAKGALRERSASLKSPFTLQFKGNNKDNIIDFSSVNMRNNLLKIEGLAGDDMILAPRNDLIESGLTLDELMGSSNRIASTDLNGKSKDILPVRDGINVTEPAWERNEIVIKRGDASDGTSNDQQSVFIDGKMFDKAYVLVDPSNTKDMLVVLVRRDATGKPETVVLRFENYKNFLPLAERSPPGKTGNISWLKFGNGIERPEEGRNPDQNPLSPFMNVVPLIYADMDGEAGMESGTFIDAGDGNDSVYRHKQDKAKNQEQDVEAPGGPASSDS